MNRCFGCLKELAAASHSLSINQYCRVCIHDLWSGKSPRISEYERLPWSLSQEKYLVKSVSTGTNLRFPEDKPANEHLTMQIAKQVFKLPVAVNGLFQDLRGQYHYITRRFDRSTEQSFHHKTLCEWLNRSAATHGPDYQTGISYEELVSVIEKQCRTPRIQLDTLFSWVVFNYCFGNGHCHIENFSLLETSDGDYVLSPAYALICTAVHYPYDTPLGLPLFRDHSSDSAYSPRYKREDFIQLAKHYQLNLQRTEKKLDRFKQSSAEVDHLIRRSFLSRPAQVVYRKIFEERLLDL